MSICLQCITYDQIPDISLRGGKKRRDAIAKCLVTKKVSNYTTRRFSFRRAQSVCIQTEESHRIDQQQDDPPMGSKAAEDDDIESAREETKTDDNIDQVGEESKEEERMSPLHQFCHGVAEDNEQTCSICLEPFQEGEEVSWAKYLDLCNHVYHTKCISIWLEKNFDCPCCRANFFYKPIEEQAITSRVCRNLQCLCKSAENRIHQGELEYITCRTDAEFCASQGLLFCMETLEEQNKNQRKQEEEEEDQAAVSRSVPQSNHSDEEDSESFEEAENMTVELLPASNNLCSHEESDAKENSKEFFDCVSYGDDIDVEQGYQSVQTRED